MGWFYVLEFIIMISMVVETTMRVIAVGDEFWQSLYNIFDVGFVCLCVLVFILMMKSTCGSSQAVAEEVMLVLRNIIQLARLGMIVQR